jgi:hypothetical protein
MNPKPHHIHNSNPIQQPLGVHKFSHDIKVIKLKNLSKCIEALIDSEIALSWRGTYHPQQVAEIKRTNDRNIKNLNLALHSLQQNLL